MTFFIMTVIHIWLFAVLIGASFDNAASASDSDKIEVMEESAILWGRVDNDHHYIQLNLQDKYKESSNTEYQSLIGSVSSLAFSGDTVKALNNLFNVYDTDDFESPLLEDFIDDVLDTEVMQELSSYLQNQAIIKTEAEFRSEFKRIWFESYDYGDTNGKKTSGFSHVFMGEVDDTEVKGFYNWIRYYNEEKKTRLQYKGWTQHETMGDDMPLVSLSFEWNNAVKPTSTILFGALPEYELAVMTLCYYMLPGEECPVSMLVRNANIVTEVADVSGKEYIRTAYFSHMSPAGASMINRPDIVLSLILSLFFSWRNLALYCI